MHGIFTHFTVNLSEMQVTLPYMDGMDYGFMFPPRFAVKTRRDTRDIWSHHPPKSSISN